MCDGIVLISAQHNLTRGARLVVRDVAHSLRVHSLLCPTLTAVLTTTLPLVMCPGATHVAEGWSQLKSVRMWPWGPPRCRPSSAESDGPGRRRYPARLLARMDRRIPDPLEQQDGKGHPLRLEGHWCGRRKGEISSLKIASSPLVGFVYVIPSLQPVYH